MSSTTPAEIVEALVLDLSAIGVCAFVPTGRQLQTQAQPSPSRLYTFNQPALRESPDAGRPGTQYIPAQLRAAFVFGYSKSSREGAADTVDKAFAPLYELYNVGRDMRTLFYRACATTRIAQRIEVGAVTVDPPTSNVAGQTVNGTIELLITYQDDCTSEGS